MHFNFATVRVMEQMYDTEGMNSAEIQLYSEIPYCSADSEAPAPEAGAAEGGAGCGLRTTKSACWLLCNRVSKCDGRWCAAKASKTHSRRRSNNLFVAFCISAPALSAWAYSCARGFVERALSILF